MTPVVPRGKADRRHELMIKAFLVSAVIAIMVYLLLPGIIIGLLYHAGMPVEKLKSGSRTLMPLQVYAAKHINYIGKFYEWQIEIMGIK